MSPDGTITALSYPLAEPPLPAVTVEMAPGVLWLRMPLPFALNHINLWMIQDGAGWAIVDTGIATERTKAVWQEIFDKLGQPITRLIVTHFHPDHIGLAGWLTETFGIELWTSEGEFLHGHLAYNANPAKLGPIIDHYYMRTGLDAAARAPFQKRVGLFKEIVNELPYRLHRLIHGMEIEIGGRSWRILTGGGHAFEHVCLHCAELDIFISGDQILPRISPHIGVWLFEPDGDALGRYLASLHQLRAEVPDTVLVLPSHGLPFQGLHFRIDQLLALHASRLAALEAACNAPSTVADLMPVLFQRTPDEHQLGFALGETMAHLHRAVADGRLVRSERADGAWLFARP